MIGMEGKKIKQKNRKKDSGFTLIEIMIAMFILGVGLIGALSFFSSSVKSNSDTKTELIAAGLAQEGVELVRNLADYRKLHDYATWSDLTNLSTGLPACTRIDYNSLTTTHSCQTGDYVRFFGGRYQQYGSNPGTGMKRTIQISCLNSADGPANCNTPANVKSLKIVCSVTWNDRTTTATDRLYENNY
jgi:prepilin-type N-terminal cleavage/methylation domain-containing protein